MQDCILQARFSSLFKGKLAVKVGHSVHLPRSLEFFATSKEKFLRHLLDLAQKAIHNFVDTLLVLVLFAFCQLVKQNRL